MQENKESCVLFTILSETDMKNSLFALQEILVNTGLIGELASRKSKKISGYAINILESEYFYGRMDYFCLI